jgi:SAM-dependent methyltransferase
VIFVPTPPSVVPQMLKMAGVTADDVVYDLGCGDGRIIIAAAKERGAKGIGVELDPRLVQLCNENAKKAGVDDRVQFLQQDLFLCDFSDASVVMLYLMPTINVKLRPKLFKELKPGTRVVSHNFDMGDWEPEQKILLRPESRWLYLWIMPAYVQGEWDAKLVGPNGQPQNARLHLRQAYQKVSGTVEMDDHRYDLLDGRMRGDELTFGVYPGGDVRKPPVRYTCRMVTGADAGRTVAAGAEARSEASATSRPAAPGK